MANVHGFGRGGGGDDEDPENPRGPMPNPWTGGSAGPAPAAGHTLVCGEMINIGTLKAHQYCLLCCCPCLVGPLCSRNRRTNYVNIMKTLSFCIFLACVVMFAVSLGVAGGFVAYAQNPMLGPDSYTLARLGAAYGWRMQTKAEVYRLLSPAFLHGGVFHLLGNMAFLLMLGVPCEQKWGWPRYAAVYFVSALGASIFSVCLHPNTISVGASGALFGLMGAMLSDLLMHWARVDPASRRMQLIQQVVVICIWMLFSFGVPLVDGWAHLGGLLCGLMLGVALWAPEHEGYAAVTKFGRPAAVGLLALFFLLLGGLFFSFVIGTKEVFADY